MKTIWLVRLRDRGTGVPAAARATTLIRNASWPSTALRISLLVATDNDTAADAPADLLIQCWSELPAALPPGLAEALEPDCDVHRLDVEERVRKDVHGWHGRGAVPGVSLLAFCTSPAGQPRHETLRHWTEHVALALAVHHGAERYIQNVVLPDDAAERPWFGIADLHFPDRDGIPGYLFRTEADVARITNDVADFIAMSPTILATEEVLRA